MKSMRIVILAIAAIICAGANAAAQELTVNPPEIKGKLNALVEEKMNVLIDNTDVNLEPSDARKEMTNAGGKYPDATQHSFIYVLTDSRK